MVLAGKPICIGGNRRSLEVQVGRTDDFFWAPCPVASRWRFRSDDKYRANCSSQQRLRLRSKQEAVYSRSAMCADHDEICALFCRQREEFARNQTGNRNGFSLKPV